MKTMRELIIRICKDFGESNQTLEAFLDSPISQAVIVFPLFADQLIEFLEWGEPNIFNHYPELDDYKFHFSVHGEVCDKCSRVGRYVPNKETIRTLVKEWEDSRE